MLNVKNIKVVEEMAKNQYIIATDKDIVFQSYNSTIAIIRCGELIYIGTDWDYSKTTSKFRNLFFKKYLKRLDTTKELKKFIAEFMEYSGQDAGYISKEYKFLFR